MQTSQEIIQYLQTTGDDIVTRRTVVFENAKEYFGTDKICTDKGEPVNYPSNDLDGCAVGRLLPREYVARNPVEGDLDALPEYIKVLGEEFITDLAAWHDSVKYRDFYERDITKTFLCSPS